jgi:Protein of unknown function (DUF3617)
MTRLALLPTILCLPVLISACGKSEPDAAGTANKAAVSSGTSTDGTKPRPGLWRMTFSITEISAPGAPPEVAQMLTSMTKTSEESSQTCMTKADSEEGMSKIVSEMRSGEACTTKSFTEANGEVRAEITCGAADKAGTLTLNGRYSANAMDLTIVGAMPNAGEMGDAKMTMSLKGERIGECPA